MASRILGLVRDQVVAFYFGAGDAVDAFRVAFRLPNLVRDLFAEGAMSAAFVPTFTAELTREGKARAFQLANAVITALIAVTGILVLAGIIWADPLVRMYAGEFAAVPGKLELAITMAQIMAPFLTLVAVAAVCMGMLNALGHFFIPALSPAMFNLATIVLVLALVPLAPALGITPIVIVAAATLVGGLGQLAIQWRPLAHEGFAFRPSFAWRDPALGRVLLLMGPGTIGMAATQINVLVNTQFAAGEGTGAISWLDYAFRVMYLPIGLFGVSMAAASTPALSRLAAASDMPRFRTTVGSAMGLMLALNLPATLGLIVLAGPIVALIFERGQFTAADSAATAAALRYYAIGLVGYSIVRIVSPAFYALHRSHIPVVASIASVIANITLNMVLVRVMGYAGLALGTSVAAIVNATIQIVWLRHAIGGIDGRRVMMTFLKVTLASTVMAAAAYVTELWLHTLMPGQTLALRLLRVGLAIAVALGVLAIAASVLRVREFDESRDMILRRFGRLVR
jgi:putative peptidoglycan lipid II flippase